MKILIPLLLLTLASGACTTLPASEPATSSAEAHGKEHDSPLAALLHSAQGWRRLTASEQAAELERLTRQYTAQRSEEHRLRLALFHVSTPHGDRARALQLLDAPGSEAQGTGRNHPLAALLIPLLQERARADEQNTLAQQKQRDEQRRSEVLQQKLDALREIEKKMLDRPGR